MGRGASRILLRMLLMLTVLGALAPAAATGQSGASAPVVGITTELPQRPGCTMVELRPGYPGYRGNVTGVMGHAGGSADYDCLEKLVEIDPKFDKVREDRANQAAATALGITGSPDLWVWENWMQIEAQRGWLPSCYACLMVDDASTPFNSGVQAAHNDYRNIVGFMGQTSAISTTAINLGFDSMTVGRTVDLLGDDYVLRAKAFAVAGPSANALQLQKAFSEVVSTMWTVGAPYLGPEHIGTVVFRWGGYILTPTGTAPLDQTLTMYYGLVSAEVTYPELIISQFETSVTEWEAMLMTSSPPYPTLAEYMRQQPYWQGFRI
jgi:hypothetical protein